MAYPRALVGPLMKRNRLHQQDTPLFPYSARTRLSTIAREHPRHAQAFLLKEWPQSLENTLFLFVERTHLSV